MLSLTWQTDVRHREDKSFETLTLFSGFLRIFLGAAGGQATFGTTTFIIFDWWLCCCCCCDKCDAEAFDVFVLLLGGNVSVIHWSTERLRSRGPSLHDGRRRRKLVLSISVIESENVSKTQWWTWKFAIRMHTAKVSTRIIIPVI